MVLLHGATRAFVCSTIRRSVPSIRLKATPFPPTTRSLTFTAPRRSLPTQAPTPSGSSIPPPSPYYCTTPIFYVNAQPHIGHLHSDVLADILTRWHQIRYCGWSPNGSSAPDSESTEALLATGTDEHGLKIQKAAEANGETPKQLCDRVSLTFELLAIRSGVRYTDFIRTTEGRHRTAVHEVWKRLVDRGHIYKGSHEGWYSISDEAFYPEGQIKQVTHPESGETYKVSTETGSRVEWTAEENWKFRMSAFKDKLVDWIQSNPSSILPASRRNQLLDEVQSGLEDLSVSRPSTRLTWGIPVPGDPSQTIYVWIDALVNYLTVTGFPTSQRNTIWPADAHVIGKDIIRFHAVYWPCILMAAELPLPHSIITHGHWTKDRAKIAKSTGNVVDPFAEIAKYGKDSIRFYLAKMGGNLEKDSDYSHALLAENHNKWLAGQLGNLVARLRTPKTMGILCRPARSQPTQNKGEAEGEGEELPPLNTGDTFMFPCPEPGVHHQLRDLEDLKRKLPEKFTHWLSKAELSRALDEVFEVISEANRVFNAVSPWRPDVDPHLASAMYYWLVETLRVVELCLRCIMPDKMREMRSILDFDEGRVDKTWEERLENRKHVSLVYSSEKPPILFPRFKEE